MLVQKKQLRQNKKVAQKKNLKNLTIKTVARTSLVKNVRMVTTATAIVNRALVDVVLLHLLLVYKYQ
ncbi:hypothetical protein AR686_11185 [Chryseobacterium aquaticum subsp. greenlandense]|uniref:Uncharacterized protein n=1 Tax=Chryseobacterium aquaticum subsp. greenlandense TaxID=345663 RepID=A0A101CHS3_9FLAO|nr:hypothetical protein AR686_11185 [Chryseobacterium aquaticum subsp. greenlandense]